MKTYKQEETDQKVTNIFQVFEDLSQAKQLEICLALNLSVKADLISKHLNGTAALLGLPAQIKTVMEYYLDEKRKKKAKSRVKDLSRFK